MDQGGSASRRRTRFRPRRAAALGGRPGATDRARSAVVLDRIDSPCIVAAPTCPERRSRESFSRPWAETVDEPGWLRRDPRCSRSLTSSVISHSAFGVGPAGTSTENSQARGRDTCKPHAVCGSLTIVHLLSRPSVYLPMMRRTLGARRGT